MLTKEKNFYIKRCEQLNKGFKEIEDKRADDIKMNEMKR